MILNNALKYLGASPHITNFLGGIWEHAGRQTSAGIDVNESVALTYSAVWAATRLLTEPPAMMPLKIYRRRPDGGKDEQATHPLSQILQHTPNEEMSAQSWRELVGEWAVNWGMGYSEIQREGNKVIALWPIHPNRVRLRRNDMKQIVWEVQNNAAPPTFIADADMFYVPGAVSDNGITGKGIIQQAREVIGWGLGTQKYGETFFGNGAKPSGILSTSAEIGADKRREYRQEWIKGHGGPYRANKIAFLDNGLTFTPMSVPNEDAQFIETMQFQITDIARWYNVPPHMLQELTRATFNNIEEMSAAFVRYSLLPWLKRWEQQIRRKLFSLQDRADGMFAEFGVEGLLRGDIKTRYETYATGRQWGWFSVNDIRKLENLNPISDGDTYLVPGNMLPAGDVGGMMDKRKSDADLLSRIDTMEQSISENATVFKSMVPTITQQLAKMSDTGKADKGNIVDAMRPLLTHTLERLMVKEANEVTRRASCPKKFWTWLSDSDFYERHELLMLATLMPIADSLTMLMGEAHASDTILALIVPNHIERSRGDLLTMTGRVKENELTEGVEALLACWQDRAAIETEGILELFNKVM